MLAVHCNLKSQNTILFFQKENYKLNACVIFRLVIGHTTVDRIDISADSILLATDAVDSLLCANECYCKIL